MKLKYDVNAFDLNSFMDMLQKHMLKYDDRIKQLNLKPSALTRIVKVSYALYTKLWSMQNTAVSFIQSPTKPRMLKIGDIWFKYDTKLYSHEGVIPTIPSLPSLRTLYRKGYKFQEILSVPKPRTLATNTAMSNRALSDAMRTMTRMVGEVAMREHWTWGKFNTAIRGKVKNFGRVTSLGSYVRVQVFPYTQTVIVEIADQGSLGGKPFDEFTYFFHGTQFGGPKII